jgi:hypothetical protein
MGEAEDGRVAEEDLSLAAVRANGLALQYVREQTHEICMAAVAADGLALRYVKEQTTPICMAAVKQNGLALKHVKRMSSLASAYYLLVGA